MLFETKYKGFDILLIDASLDMDSCYANHNVTLFLQSQIVASDNTYFAIFTEAYRRFLSSFYTHNR